MASCAWRRGLDRHSLGRTWVTEVTEGAMPNKFGGQASKGIRWMPRRQEAKKDVVSCEKPRGAANKRRSVDVRMGKPLPSHVGRAQS
jgi:hypothetical protein